MHVRGGVRLRSRLSPGGRRNQKWHFKAITGTFFIRSYKLGAYYVKSYKNGPKGSTSSNHLIYNGDWGWNIEILIEICIFLQIAILLWFLYRKIDSGQFKWKRRSRPFRICVTHRGGELFPTGIGYQSLLTWILVFSSFWNILYIFQILRPDQPKWPETNRTSKQP